MTDRARPSTRRWRRTPLGGLALIVIALLAYLPGLFTIPPVDRDESRFAQASRQVMESIDAGDLEGAIVPRIRDEPRLNKPPLIYWLQSASAWWVDRDAGAGADPVLQRIGWYRLPSALCALLAALFLWRAGCVLYRGDEGWWAALLLATCVMVLWDARQARADELLLACTTGALWAMAGVWSRWRLGRRVPLPLSLGLGCAIALGVLAKGPITPMVVALALLALLLMGAGWGLVRAVRPLSALGLVLVLALPWVIGVGASVGFERYFELIADETLGRAASAKESHWGPPGYHLVLLAFLLFPGSLVTLVGIVRALKRTRRPARFDHRAPEALLLAWVVPAWLVFEVVATKLPHYTLVLYPALALLSARALVVLARARRSVGVVGLVVWGLLGLTLCAAPLALTLAFDAPTDHPNILLGLGGSLLALLCLAMGLWDGWRRRLLDAQAWGVWSVLCLALGLFHGTLPALRTPWPSSTIAQALHEADPAGTAPLAHTGYHEDSLIFLTRGRIERVPRARLLAWLEDHPGGFAVIAVDEEAGIPLSVGRRAPAIASIDGFNYSKGEPVRLVLLEAPRSRRPTITDPTQADDEAR